MKTLTCNELGGPAECAEAIRGDSFDEVANACKAHVKDQLEKGDAAHAAAVERMKNATPEEQQAMFAEYTKKYENAPES